MGNYYGDYSQMLNGILNGVVDDAKRAGSWTSWTVTLPPVEIPINSIKSGSFAANAINPNMITAVDTPPQFLEASAKYQRERAAALIDNPWHTEVRERYTLKPQSLWKLPALSAALMTASFAAYDWHVHKPLAGHALGAVLAFGFMLAANSVCRRLFHRVPFA